MVIHNIEKASAAHCAQTIEYFRLHIEYLWNTVENLRPYNMLSDKTR